MATAPVGRGAQSEQGSFERTCPANEMRDKMRKGKNNKKEEHPQGYLDEDFDYDIVTTYDKSDKCAGIAKRFERFRAHCKQVTAKDLWWNRQRDKNTCSSISVFTSDYCGSTFPEPVLRKERFRRLKHERLQRSENERQDIDNNPKEDQAMVEVDPSSTSSGNKNSTSTGMIVGSTLGSLAVVAIIAIGLHLNKTRRRSTLLQTRTLQQLSIL